MSLVYVIMFKFTTGLVRQYQIILNIVIMGPSYVGIDKDIAHQHDMGVTRC
jgi:hypothetical protein